VRQVFSVFSRSPMTREGNLGDSELRRRYDFSHLRSVPLEPRTLARFDCVVIVTDHSAYDSSQIVQAARLVVDTRNATRGVACA
jgi:UDP-N-acetyl-D-glucosamine dehydrogenase